MTRGEKVIAFISRYCVVPEGNLIGQPLKLLPFQEDFIKAIYDNPHGTDTAILSIARKNAKTATIACLVLAHLVGPEAVQNSHIASGALSREQASQVFKLASKMVQLSPELSRIVKIIPSSKKLIGLPMNVEYQALSAEAKTAHGGSLSLAIVDEVGQVRGAQSDFIDAITTSQAAYENPLLIYISTQAANDADLLSVLIDDYRLNKHPKTVCHVYEAPADADVSDESAWLAANPALGEFRSMDDMRKQAEKAARMPSFENTFRNLNLNQRVSVHAPFISKDVWQSCRGDIADLADCEVVYGGLDLSARTDLTALVLVGRADDKWHARAHFWTPEETLIDRSKTDRAPYDVWVDQGYIRAVRGKVIDYRQLAPEIAELTEGLPLESLGYDRWRMDILKKEFDEIGVRDLPLVEFGQGFKDMSPAIEALEEFLLNGELLHDGNPVLTMCAANASIVKNVAGDRKLEKAKNTGRIDGIVALAMAVGLAQRQESRGTNLDSWVYDPLIL